MPKSAYDKQEQAVIDIGGQLAEQVCFFVAACISQHPDKARKAGKRFTEHLIDLGKAMLP